MRVPHPAALLVEHPTVPEPEITGGVVREGPGFQTARAVARSLSRRDRLRAGVQLTAAVSLLAEFDLWPGRAAFAGLRLERTEDGVRPIFGCFPLPLSQVVDRIGGGEAAVEAVRRAAVERIAFCLQLPVTDLQGEQVAPGLTFEVVMSRLLRELPQPLDVATARSLWALRWEALPPPTDGLIGLWRVPLEATARRLAAALWCDLRRRGRRAWLWPAEGGDADTSSIPAVSGQGTVILVGRVSNRELNALGRWVAREGCSAVAVGLFPRGWSAGPPPLGRGLLSRHLAIAGLPSNAARTLIEARQGRFAALEKSDRAALTEAVRLTLTPAQRRRGRAADLEAGELEGWLALSPDGLPPGFVGLQSRLTPAVLEAQRRAAAVVEADGRWRLAEPAALERDPRHLLVAELYPRDHPMHRLHTALGSGDTAPLEGWARCRLDSLDAVAVRELLSMVQGGALGEKLQLLLAEACLAVLDIGGAGSALATVPESRRVAYHLWIEALDPVSGGAPRRLPDAAGEAESRAAAEIACLVLDDSPRTVRREASDAALLAERCRGRLRGELRQRIEIEIAFRISPEHLDDAFWRRRTTAGNPALRAQLAHRRALWHLEGGRYRNARRLLEVVARDTAGPGPRGVIELDLGAVALSEGRSRDAEGHHLRAYNLLRTAGFRNRTAVPLFNLAVADVDQLRVRRATERLDRLATLDPQEPFVIGEQARLALAVGDEAVFRRRLAHFERTVDDRDPRFAEGLALLRGAGALLDGDPRRAARHLARAGQEGETWGALAAAVAGGADQPVDADDWGVSRAATLVRVRLSNGAGPLVADLADGGINGAFALALAERACGEQIPVAAELRSALVGRLRQAGLRGWAEFLGGLHERAGVLVSSLARLVETGDLETMEPRDLENLEAGLGLTGFEIRTAVDGALIWRHGRGAPGGEIRHGRLAVTPLGGVFDGGPSSRLVAGVLDLVLPPATAVGDGGADATGFHGASEAARNLRRELRELGPSHLPILLVGETGVGKEVAARALHRLSRREGPFVAVNVAAIPATLLEAELFGSVKGAFTGADRSRSGLAVTADGGTLFLDEIGDLDAQLQVKLLRFIETGEVRAVGSTHTRKVDVRILSATNRGLDQRMREGGFRRDLYFRIAAPEVAIPPLRDRLEDIPLLRELFEREAHEHHGLPRPTWRADSESLLQRYHWPGNVRELRQVIEVAMVRAQGGVVRAEQLPIAAPDGPVNGTWDEAQREFRRRYLIAALQRNQGNRSATARELGISRQALLYHIRNLGLQDLD